MNLIILPAEHEIHIHTNGNNGVEIRQYTGDPNDPEQVVTFGSKRRLLEVIESLRAAAKTASFKPVQGND